MTTATFEKKIKPILNYIGIICAGLASLAYIGLVLILVFGFRMEKQPLADILVYSAVNAVFGIIISLFISWNGQIFAKNLDANRDIIKKFYAKEVKKKKGMSLGLYWFLKIMINIFIKGAAVAFSTFGVIYIVVQACRDWTYLLLAAVSLVLFIGFGLLGMVNTFDWYNERYVQYMEDKVNEKERKLMEETVELRENKHFISDNCGNNILGGSGGNSTPSPNNQSVVLDSVCECVCDSSNTTSCNTDTNRIGNNN